MGRSLVVTACGLDKTLEKSVVDAICKSYNYQKRVELEASQVRSWEAFFGDFEKKLDTEISVIFQITSLSVLAELDIREIDFRHWHLTIAPYKRFLFEYSKCVPDIFTEQRIFQQMIDPYTQILEQALQSRATLVSDIDKLIPDITNPSNIEERELFKRLTSLDIHSTKRYT